MHPGWHVRVTVPQAAAPGQLEQLNLPVNGGQYAPAALRVAVPLAVACGMHARTGSPTLSPYPLASTAGHRDWQWHSPGGLLRPRRAGRPPGPGGGPPAGAESESATGTGNHDEALSAAIDSELPLAMMATVTASPA